MSLNLNAEDSFPKIGHDAIKSEDINIGAILNGHKQTIKIQKMIIFEGKVIQIRKNSLNFLAVRDKNEIIAGLKVGNRAKMRNNCCKHSIDPFCWVFTLQQGRVVFI